MRKAYGLPVTVKIRKLGKDDVDLYQSLRCAALNDAPTLFIESLVEFKDLSQAALKEQICKEEGFHLGAFREDQELIGMIGFQRETAPRLKHIGLISGLYVTPAARGQSLGENLISCALAEARRLGGVEQVKLQLEAGNMRARKLYESIGFEVWGTEPRAVKIGELYYDDLHMILKSL